MKSASLALIFTLLATTTALSKDLNLLGERPSQCNNQEKDDYQVFFHQSLKKQAESMMENNRLKAAVIASPQCFRVGTEVQLFAPGITKPYLGRALIQKMRLLSKAQLLKDNSTNFSKASLRDFANSTTSKQYGILYFKVTEKMEEVVVNEQYSRLPSCFPAYGDWKSMRLKTGEEGLLKQIQTKKKKALIWNGTFNCYKVGVYTSLTLPESETRNAHGYIVPTELHIVHLSNLSSKHAKILGESLSKLKQRLAEKKDIEGGYATMVVFDYEKTHPKDLEEAATN